MAERDQPSGPQEEELCHEDGAPEVGDSGAAAEVQAGEPAGGPPPSAGEEEIRTDESEAAAQLAIDDDTGLE